MLGIFANCIRVVAVKMVSLFFSVRFDLGMRGNDLGWIGGFVGSVW